MMRRTGNKYIAVKPNQPDEEDLNLGVVALVEGKDTAAAAQLSASSVSEEDGLTWTDDYFSDRTDVVAVFDFNQEDYASSSNIVLFSTCFGPFLRLLPIFVFLQVMVNTLVGGVFTLWFFVLAIFKYYNIREKKKHEKVWIPHLAVTTTGVRYVEPPENIYNFLGSTVLIPFKEIESVEIQTAIQTARAIIFGVRIRTASTDSAHFVVNGCPRDLLRIRRHQDCFHWREDIVPDGEESNGTRLDIKFLLDPYRFKTLVLSLKQQQESKLIPVAQMEAVASAVVET